MDWRCPMACEMLQGVGGHAQSWGRSYLGQKPSSEKWLLRRVPAGQKQVFFRGSPNWIQRASQQLWACLTSDKAFSCSATKSLLVGLMNYKSMIAVNLKLLNISTPPAKSRELSGWRAGELRFRWRDSQVSVHLLDTTFLMCLTSAEQRWGISSLGCWQCSSKGNPGGC